MKAIIGLLVMVLSVLVSIWVLMVGWGLSAKSWSVIVWGAVFHSVLLLLMTAVNDRKSP